LQHDAEEIQLPAVVLECSGDSLLNSPLVTGQLTVAVLSQADDSTIFQHMERVQAVGAAINALQLVDEAVNLYGIISTGSEAQNTERHWVTNLKYKAGFGPSVDN
jgi:glycerol-3-phosphate responsive antiterminator